MIITFFTLLATALSLLLVDLAVPGVDIATFPAALVAAIAISCSIHLPSRFCLKSPATTLLNLGLFSIVVNGVCLLAAVLVLVQCSPERYILTAQSILSFY